MAFIFNGTTHESQLQQTNETYKWSVNLAKMRNSIHLIKQS